MSKSDARERFMKTILKYNTRTTENFEIVMKMANRLYQAEAVGFKLDPDSVEKALKNILGVDGNEEE